MSSSKNKSIVLKTLKVRVRDRHFYNLNNMAFECNTVWNYCNELSFRAINERQTWLSGYDIEKYTKGTSKLLSIDSTCIQSISTEYTTRRRQFKKAKLNWRKTGGTRRSLGWVPFKKGAAKWVNGQVKYAGKYFKVFDSFGLSQYEFRAGSFTEDARGKWYFNIVVAFKPKKSKGQKSVGIDLGCKTSATTSNGEALIQSHYRKHEASLGIAQRANNKKRVKAIHAKIRNCRKNDSHQFTSRLVKESALIFVGNVSSKGLSKTKLAKSVLDAGWGIIKQQLSYKCEYAGCYFEVVNESYSSQTCSSCQEITDSSPKGRAGLGMREWSCSTCGAVHDRDINGALNILAVGLDRLAGEKVAA